MHSKARVRRLRATLREVIRESISLEHEAMNLGLHGKAAGFADVRQKAQAAINENSHLWEK